MPLGVTTTKYGGGDNRWLGSRHGVENAKTGTLKANSFTPKIVKSGTPVQIGSDGLYEPYTGPEGTLAGFVLGDHDVTAGNEPVPVLWHGRINVAHLPVEGFQVPENPGQFVFVPAVESEA